MKMKTIYVITEYALNVADDSLMVYVRDTFDRATEKAESIISIWTKAGWLTRLKKSEYAGIVQYRGTLEVVQGCTVDYLVTIEEKTVLFYNDQEDK